MYEKLVEEWKDCLKKIKKLEKENKDIHNNYAKKFENLNENTNKGEIKLMKENKDLKNKSQTVSKELLSELKIKDLLINRHVGFEDVLKKELIMAKNILK